MEVERLKGRVRWKSWPLGFIAFIISFFFGLFVFGRVVVVEWKIAGSNRAVGSDFENIFFMFSSSFSCHYWQWVTHSHGCTVFCLLYLFIADIEAFGHSKRNAEGIRICYSFAAGTSMAHAL